MGIKKETFWVVSSTLLNIATVFILFSLLAHFGDEDTIGELAIINIVLSIALLLQDSGLSNFFIHKQNVTEQERSSLFLINVVLGVLATFLVLLLSGYIGDFYDSESIGYCLKLVAFNFIFIGLTSQYQAFYIKTLQTDILAKIDITTKLAILVATIVLIYQNIPPLNSYIYSVLGGTLLKLLIVLVKAPHSWHPKFSFDHRILKPAVSFGTFQLGSQVINQLRTRLDQIVVGKWLGTDALSIYTIAKELVLQPNKIIGPIVSRIVLPRLAKSQKAKVESVKIFDDANNAILAFNIIAFYVLAICLHFAIPFLYGNEYVDALSIFVLLSVAGMVRPLGSIFGALAQSRGKTDVEFYWNVISFATVAIFMGIAAMFNNLQHYAMLMAVAQILLSSYAVYFFSNRIVQLDKKVHLIRVFSAVLAYLGLLLIFS